MATYQTIEPAIGNRICWCGKKHDEFVIELSVGNIFEVHPTTENIRVYYCDITGQMIRVLTEDIEEIT